jgi:hypothetical protein
MEERDTITPLVNRRRALIRKSVVLLALLCSAPLLWQWRHFSNLYWFHDDWELISQMADNGVAAWIWQPFAESWTPLFKLFWSAAIRVVNGSYTAMIVLLWATHLAIVWLLGTILLRCGFDMRAAAVAMLTLGLSWSNIETLGWATQWCPLLATLFLLLACDQLLVVERLGRRAIWRSALILLLTASSALSFSRGILTGIVLAVLLWFPPFPRMPAFWRNRVVMSLALVLIVAGVLIAYSHILVTYAAFSEITPERALDMVRFAACYELLNPLFHVLPIPRKLPDLRSVVIAGVIKWVVVAIATYVATPLQRRILGTLLTYEIGTALLVSVGRHQFGLEGAVSSRYQHVSLLCFSPFVGIAFWKATEGLSRLFVPSAARRIFYAALLAGWALLLVFPWARHAERWARWRGTDARNAVMSAPADQRFGLPSITAERARELIRLYNLH